MQGNKSKSKRHPTSGDPKDPAGVNGPETKPDPPVREENAKINYTKESGWTRDHNTHT